MPLFERNPERIVQCRLRDIEVRSPLNPLLGDGSEMHADREHVHISGHSRGTHRLGPFQVGLR